MRDAAIADLTGELEMHRATVDSETATAEEKASALREIEAIEQEIGELQQQIATEQQAAAEELAGLYEAQNNILNADPTEESQAQLEVIQARIRELAPPQGSQTEAVGTSETPVEGQPEIRVTDDTNIPAPQPEVQPAVEDTSVTGETTQPPVAPPPQGQPAATQGQPSPQQPVSAPQQPAQGQPAAQITREHEQEVSREVETAIRESRLPESTKAVGATYRRGNNFRRSFGATVTDNGIEIRINPRRIAQVTRGMAPEQRREWINRSIEEEVIHLASIEAVRRRYGKNLKGKALQDALKKEYTRVREAMTPDQVQFTRDTRDDQTIDGWQLGAEYVRMLKQMDRSQLPTEGVIRDFVKRIVDVLRDMLSNRANWSEPLQRAYDDTSRVLAEIDAKIAEEGRVTGDTTSQSEAPTQQSETQTQPKVSNKLREKIKEVFEGLEAAEPRASVEQRALPPAQLPAFLSLAQDMISEGISTPHDMVRVLDETVGAKGRHYTEALWDAFGMVNKDLRGTHDWNEIYRQIDAVADQSADTSQQPQKKKTYRRPVPEAPGGFDGSTQESTEAESVPEATPPRLRSGEQQGDIFSGQTEELTLMGESGVDGDRVAREREQAERDAEEARRNAERDQLALPGTQEQSTQDAPDSDANLESDSQGTGAQDAGSQADVPDGGAAPRPNDQPLDQSGTESGDTGISGPLSPNVPSIYRGADGDTLVSEPASELSGRDAGDAGRTGSRTPSDPRLSPQQPGPRDASESLVIPASSETLGTSSTAGLDLSQYPSVLQPEQAGDVAFVENRLYKEGHTGVLLTNGTGTGKTFSGMGVISRQLDAGAKDILVVVPSQSIADAWVRTAKEFFGINDAEILENRSTTGKGRVIVTTYANLGQNTRILDRPWSLVVADESHKLSQSQQGDSTGALDTVRAITWHPRGIQRRAQLSNPDLAEYEALQKKKDDGNILTENEVRRRLELSEQIKDKADQLLKEAPPKKDRPKLMMLSATPFAYRESLDVAEGYLFDYPPENQDTIGQYGHNTPRDQFFIDTFGYRKRTGKLTKPENATATGILERRFAEKLKAEGAMSGRKLSVGPDYSRQFVLNESVIGGRIDAIMDVVNNNPKFGAFRDMLGISDYLERRMLLEALKAKDAIDRIQKHLAMGRKVVVIHDYNKGGATNPLRPIFNPNSKYYYPDPKNRFRMLETTYGEVFEEIKERIPDYDQIAAALDALESPIEQFKEAFPDSGVFNGTISPKERLKNLKEFNRSGSKMNVLLAQRDAIKEGNSLHDTDGKHQRVLIDIGIPAKPTDAIQTEGRIYRTGVKSNAILEYLVTGTNFERWTFAQTIAQRASTAENLAMGEQARSLLQSYADGFNNAEAADPSAEQGTGGKEQDAQRNEQDPFRDAVSLFYTTEKRMMQMIREGGGTDYFATPEPVGFKMVEWADIKPGEKVLEPSAGHGAIARFFPDSTTRHAIEPHNTLAGRLALNATDITIHNQTFEDYNIQNKFDAIVMNPPFGTAGATAIAHINKAYDHLRDGGRIVAVLPECSASDKFAKWIAGKKDLFEVARIGLPPVAFSRAGTQTKTRVVILEKATDKERQDTLSSRTVRETEIKANTLEQMFENLRTVTIRPRLPVPPAKKQQEKAKEVKDQTGRPPRNVPVDPTIPAPETESNWITAEFNHTRTGVPIYVARAGRKLTTAEYRDAERNAKNAGGYYSGFKGAGAIPGFHFKTKEARDNFLHRVTGDTGLHAAEPGQTLRQADPDLPAETGTTPLLDTKASASDIAVRAGQIVQSWPETVSAADGTTVTLAVKDRGSIGSRVFHLIRDGNSIHQGKAAWLSRVPETLQNAQARLVDNQEGTRLFARKYSEGITHVVIVRPNGQIESQRAFRGSLITQFPLTKGGGRQAYMAIDWVRPDLREGEGLPRNAPNPAPRDSTVSGPRREGFRGQGGTRQSGSSREISGLNASEPKQTNDPRKGAKLSVFRSLPEDQRKIVSAIARGDTVASIADSIGITEAQVQSKLTQAAKKLETSRKVVESGIKLFDDALKEPMGKKTIGRPELANPNKDERARRLMDVTDELRKQSGQPQRLSDEETTRIAHEKLEANYDGWKALVIEKVSNGEVLTGEETVIAQTIVAKEGLDAVRSGDADKLYEQILLNDLWRVSGSAASDSLRLRQDRYKTPEQRASEFITRNITTPPQRVKDQIDRVMKEDGVKRTPEEAQKEKERKLNEREAILKRWQKRIDKIKRKLKAIGLDIDKMTDAQIAEWFREPGRARNVGAIISDEKKDVWDALYEWWISSILSAPTTQVANIVGNTANTFWDFTAQRFTEASVNLITGNQKGAQFGEFKYIAKGFLPGLSRASANFMRSWRDENTVFEESVVGTQHGRTKLDHEPGVALGRGRLGKVVRTPLRLLTAADEFAKTLIAHMQVGAEAYRIAKAEKLKGNAMANRIQELMEINPEKPSQAWINATSKAIELTFQSELGPVGKWVLDTRRRFRPAQYVVPFVTTPVNLFKMGLRKSPLGSIPLLYRVARQGMVRIGADKSGWRYTKQEFAPQFAEQLLAWGAMMAVAALAAPDDDGIPYITGSVVTKGTNKGQRELAYRTAPPLSIRIGDTWHSYARIEPFAVMAATMVDFLNIGSKVGEQDVTKLAGETFSKLVAQVKDKTFLRGISDLITAVEDPEHALDWAGNFAVSWVPNIIRSGARATDTVMREQKVWGKDDEWTEGFIESLAYKALPVANDMIFPKVDLWGKEITRGDTGSPLTDTMFRMVSVTRSQKHDPNMVDRLIVNWNNQNPDKAIAPQIPRPSWTSRDSSGKTVTTYMTREEYYKFLTRSGQRAFNRLMSRPLNVNNPTDRDIKEIRSALLKARKETREELKRERRMGN